MTGIPASHLKWEFLQYTRRKQRHLELEKEQPDFNDGVGKWWTKEELKELGEKNGLNVKIYDQHPLLSYFRMNAVFIFKKGKAFLKKT